jgi:hypothetical protein
MTFIRIMSSSAMQMINGKILSFSDRKNTEFTTPRFLRIKKLIIGMMIVRINTGSILPLCISSGVNLGVTRKYAMVPAMGTKSGWKM